MKLPYTLEGLKDGPTIVFMAGFPDDQKSGWGDKYNEILGTSFRLMFMCLPDYDKVDSEPQKKWGYNFPQIIEAMHFTISSVCPKNKVILVGHDWGSVISQFYTSIYAEKVEKLILCDVGMLTDVPLSKIHYIILYQWTFALGYALSQLFGIAIAGIFIQLMSLLIIKPFAYPLKPGDTSPGVLGVLKCYPYYYYWSRKFFYSKQHQMKASFPKVPLLFMYGEHKNVMFHDEKFLKRIQSSPTCKVVAFPNAGHWFILAHAERAIREIQDFIK